MAIVTNCCVKATIAEDVAKSKSWTDWAKEKIGLKHEENIPTTHTTSTVEDNAWEATDKAKDAKDAAKRKAEGAVGATYETAKSKAGETIGSLKDKASQSYDSVGQVKDDLPHKSKQVKDSFSGDNSDKSWTDWAKEKIGIKHNENYPNMGDTVSEKAKEAKDAATRKAGDAKESYANKYMPIDGASFISLIDIMPDV
ncbi:hypothetical protein Bca52824_041224 [Brassica carinata]|uniref:Uncharacterized protein n=1 Tax=Brassica carinata TaxID=52824 RepID=A0A8X7UW83_BRACI|nr:hypothetical protein Bca52824_041224 [Brassica carinata]